MVGSVPLPVERIYLFQLSCSDGVVSVHASGTHLPFSSVI